MTADGSPLDGSQPIQRPKRGEANYIKRPENAFILFRRQRCLEQAKARKETLSEGGPGAAGKAKRQADLSKTISLQWKTLSPEERQQWDELAAQKKREHEIQYPWYVYQPTRNKEKKGSAPRSRSKNGRARSEEDSGTDAESSSSSALMTPPQFRRSLSMPGGRSRQLSVPTLRSKRSRSPSPIERLLDLSQSDYPIDLSQSNLYQGDFQGQLHFDSNESLFSPDSMFAEHSGSSLQPPIEIHQTPVLQHQRSFSLPFEQQLPTLYTDFQPPRSMSVGTFSPRSSISSAPSDPATPESANQWHFPQSLPSNSSLSRPKDLHVPRGWNPDAIQSVDPRDLQYPPMSPPQQENIHNVTMINPVAELELPSELSFTFDMAAFEGLDYSSVDLGMFASDLSTNPLEGIGGLDLSGHDESLESVV